MVKRGKGYFQNSGESWLKEGVKKFRGVWTLDEAMTITRTIESVSLYSPVTDSRH